MFDVIIPIYNVEESLLKRCFDSVKKQTFDSYQVWVCDGKPSDENKSLVESYGFNYLEQQPEFNRVGGARNQAIQQGNQPYIAFLDGDDWWYDYHLKEMAKEIEKSDSFTAVWSAVCDTHYRLESRKTGEIYEMERLYGHYGNTEFLERNPFYSYYWFFGHPPAPTTTCVERDAFEKVNGFDDRFSILEDTECWMRIVGDPRKNEGRRGYVPVPMISGYHFIGENNTTNRGSQTPAFEEGIEKIFSLNSDLFLEKHPHPIETDKPDDMSKADWEFIMETSKGVNRTQIFNI